MFCLRFAGMTQLESNESDGEAIIRNGREIGTYFYQGFMPKGKDLRIMNEILERNRLYSHRNQVLILRWLNYTRMFGIPSPQPQ